MTRASAARIERRQLGLRQAPRPTSARGTVRSAALRRALPLVLFPGRRRGSSEPYPGFDFYIDSVNGSDSNAGTSSAAPWATLGKLVSAGALANNVRIGLARGSFWREMLDVHTYTGVVVTGYGSTSLPLPTIDCSDIASSGGWALTGGRTKAYDRAWSHSVTTANFICLYEDGEPLTWVSSAATCESTPGSYFVSNTIANPATIYYHPTGSGDPASNGKVVAITARDYAIWGGTGSILTGVRGLRNGNNNGSLLADTLQSCLMGHGTKHNGFSRLAYDCVFYKAPSPTGRWGTATMHVAYGGNDGTFDVQRCYAIGSGFASVTGFYAHTPGGANTWASATFKDLYAYRVDQVCAAQDTVSTLIQNIFAERCGIPFAAATNPSTSATVIDNVTVVATSADGSSPANPSRIVNSFPTAGTVDVTDLRFYSSGIPTTGGLFIGVNCPLSVKKSSFYLAGSGFSILYSSSSATALITNEDNVCWGLDKVFELTNAAGLPAASEDNVVYSTGAVENKLENTNRLNWSAYRTAYPQFDANTSTSDPLFTTNPQTAGDFSLQAGTPADTGGRAAGSRKHIARPDWAGILAKAEAGFLPWETIPA